MVNNEQLKKELATVTDELKEFINSVKTDIFSKFEEFENRVAELEVQTSRAIDIAEANSVKIDALSGNITLLEAENVKLREKLANSVNVEMGGKVTELEEKVEERTNRQLRETLVIKGVPEEDGESWERTTEIIAEIFANGMDNINSKDDAKNYIKRAHREKPTDRRTGQRNIFCALFNWNLAEDLKEKFRMSTVKYKGSRVYIDQMYGPLTTWRRNKALEVRKSLKAQNKIAKAYVAYPSKLMVCEDITSKKYVLHNDFSKDPVVFKE